MNQEGLAPPFIFGVNPKIALYPLKPMHGIVV